MKCSKCAVKMLFRKTGFVALQKRRGVIKTAMIGNIFGPLGALTGAMAAGMNKPKTDSYWECLKCGSYQIAEKVD